MTEEYELDATGGSGGENGGDADGDGARESLGVAVPDDHVAAFVAEAFEDAERDTDWAEVVESVVADDAREAWAALSAREQAAELLEMAAEYDERAVERLAAVPLDRADLSGEARERFADAKRCRRNADRIRDGVADGFAAGRLDESDLVGALEAVGFDTDTIAEREDALEAVDGAYDVDFRPYGGTLVDEDDGGVPEGEVW
ncbi:hypothetical protein [Haloplanus halophilus]|uniref:hypothetical protein n=1 Tax=Haloplanus halophilus TaxID=2949993 RepID=UPI00203E8779|nr:hypothetical protein [Haloplanus sp. GDY1]